MFMLLLDFYPNFINFGRWYTNAINPKSVQTSAILFLVII